jgi:oligoribonuclease NrnB/cAMP/cGMP phosphodiesterase (DHH superfamily)
MMMDLIECGYTISVYDHHASNEWCNDIDGINSFVMERNSYDENESGASVLFWNRYRDILNIPSIIKFVEAVRGYDVFEFDDLHHEGLYLNKMLHMMSIEAFEDYWVAQLNQLSDNQTPKSLNNFYSVHDFYENQLRDEAYLPLFDSVTNLFISSALNAEEKKIEELSNKPGWMFEAGGYRFSVFMSDSSINMSNVAQVYLQKNPDVDVFVFVIINTNGYCGYSFRTSNPEINVSEFAKLFNGGGHPMAAGASIHRDTVEALQKLFTEDLGNKIG